MAVKNDSNTAIDLRADDGTEGGNTYDGTNSESMVLD